MPIRFEKEEIKPLQDEAEEEDESRSEYIRPIIRNRDSAKSKIESAAELVMIREVLFRLDGEIERLYENFIIKMSS
ncbi:hypothetical protein ACFFQF_18355 [Haladaptatus pallidirubidus]|uniref:Uncharacterized protein n=1 Tax=Haladaptatus pallidirubidus TaxID=1008152 RepID=A0AAV3UQG6_9EURY|nr:hypothetical protein [Haladaptatus pallidirubidus]